MAPTLKCEDVLISGNAWLDTAGSNCVAYFNGQFCGRGENAGLAKDGFDGDTACCACGGGGMAAMLLYRRVHHDLAG